jgi:hypothetical protein
LAALNDVDVGCCCTTPKGYKYLSQHQIIIHPESLLFFQYEMVAQLADTLRYKPKDRGFDSRLEIFIDLIVPVDAACNRNELQRYLLW